ncbi:MAG: hypothetical protein OHK0046_48000 [Anaerolineae bacterium]
MSGTFGDQFELKQDVAHMINVVRLCQEFTGWTLEYVESLSADTVAAIWGILDGQRTLAEYRQKQKNAK